RVASTDAEGNTTSGANSPTGRTAPAATAKAGRDVVSALRLYNAESVTPGTPARLPSGTSLVVNGTSISMCVRGRMPYPSAISDSHWYDPLDSRLSRAGDNCSS